MTSQPRTATLSEGLLFVERLQALFREAEEAGFTITVDINRDPWDSVQVESVDLDLNIKGGGFIDTIRQVEH